MPVNLSSYLLKEPVPTIRLMGYTALMAATINGSVEK
jgi:hypothetical protein